MGPAYQERNERAVDTIDRRRDHKRLKKRWKQLTVCCNVGLEQERTNRPCMLYPGRRYTIRDNKKGKGRSEFAHMLSPWLMLVLIRPVPPVVHRTSAYFMVQRTEEKSLIIGSTTRRTVGVDISPTSTRYSGMLRLPGKWTCNELYPIRRRRMMDL